METNKFEYRKPFKWEGVKTTRIGQQIFNISEKVTNAWGLQWHNYATRQLTWGIYRSGDLRSILIHKAGLLEVAFIWIRITTSCVGDTYCRVRACGRSDNKEGANPWINHMRQANSVKYKMFGALSGPCQQQSHSLCSFWRLTNCWTPPSRPAQASSGGSLLRQKFWLYMILGHHSI
jgi:hypothetical protein